MEDVPPHRACQHCRSQKIRCVPSENPDVCQRCMRVGRPCVFAPIAKRRQRKRTDTRVAELEREMRLMRSQLQRKEVEVQSEATATSQALALSYKDDMPTQLSTIHRETGDANSVVALGGKNRGAAPSLWPATLPDKPIETSRDAIDNGLLSMATARRLFETYKAEMCPLYPLVYVEPSTTAEELRRDKPTLFLAIIAAASTKDNPELSATLDKEVLQSYALRSLVLSQKSLELVQALILSAAWYYPPQRFGQIKYYEYVCMAVSMAMDLGIGTHASSHHHPVVRDRRKQNATATTSALHPAEDFRNPDLSMSIRQLPTSADTASLEARRTFLSCYIISVVVSLSLKRPNMIRVSSYIRECLDYLETAPDAAPTDLQLVAWGRLVIIAEEISIAFRYDDTGDTVTIADLQTQMMLKEFQARLTAWERSLPQSSRGAGPLSIVYYTVRLHLFEVALHVDHLPEDFKAPYQMGGVETKSYAAAVPTKVLAGAVAECVSSAHAMISAFLDVDVDSLRALPVLSFVRVTYAAFILAKLSLSAATPSSRIAQVLDPGCLQAEHYLNRAILHVRGAVETIKARVPSIFMALLFKLRQWCSHPVSLIEAASAVPDDDIFDDAVREPRLNHTVECEVHRLSEQPSSNESSPQTLGSRNSSSNSQLPPSVTYQPATVTGATTLAQSAYLGPQSVQNELGNTSAYGDMLTAYPDAVSTSGQQRNAAQLGVVTDMGDNLFTFLGDTTTFPEGGLTGLDTWGDITQADLMNWQFPFD